MKEEKPMELKTRYKFIHFVSDVDDDGKSIVYLCKNNKHVDVLGYVAYDFAWKQYIFSPELSTIFSVDCMQDIIHFIGQLK